MLKDFIAVSGLKSIEVTAPKAEDSGRLRRRPKAILNSSSKAPRPVKSSTRARPPSSLLTSPSFDDVLARTRPLRPSRMRSKPCSPPSKVSHTVQAARRPSMAVTNGT